jgi:CXXX repeat modification system protein
MKELIGTVTADEIDIIKDLNDKKIALENLIKIIKPNDNESLYNSLIVNYNKTYSQYQDWWNNISIKFKLDNETICNIDFITGEIFTNV